MKTIRRMIYTNDIFNKPEVLYHDKYKDYEYYIASIGRYPICWISNNENVYICHSYNRGDRVGEYYQSGHTWKTTELIKECIQTIDEIRGDNNGIN